MELGRFLKVILNGELRRMPLFFLFNNKLYIVKTRVEKRSNGYDIQIKLIDVTPG